MSRAYLGNGLPFELISGARLGVGRHPSLLYPVVKRAIDAIGALTLLVLLSPVMLVSYLVLMVTTRGKPFFAQERLGKKGKPFRMIKFRTMVPNAEDVREQVANEKDGPIFKNRRDPRITRLGRILRSTSIDETPQLFNVLVGSMSLVGPRPPLESEVAKYEPWHAVRLMVKPGLTCLWQVSGRSDLPFAQWMRMDAWYVRNRSLLVDLWLLARTPLSVLSRKGAY